MREKTWRERHPFLYGLCMTFGIAQVRQPVDTVEESFSRVLDDIEAALAKVKPTFPYCVQCGNTKGVLVTCRYCSWDCKQAAAAGERTWVDKVTDGRGWPQAQVP